jgi:hypothetical protein
MTDGDAVDFRLLQGQVQDVLKGGRKEGRKKGRKEDEKR